MKLERRNAGAMIVLLAAIVAFSAVTGTSALAQTDTCIPEGATIQSAVFTIHVSWRNDQVVSIHRVTAPWAEGSVTWNSFGGSYDPTVLGTFVADSAGGFPYLRSVDLTSLVQGWVDGTYDNNGILLTQNVIDYAQFTSSEGTFVSLRPQLEVCYTVGGGSPVCVTIQRPSVAPDDVADAYISALHADTNFGSSSILVTGLVNGYQKHSLVWFDICEFTDCVAPGTPGYWKNHPEAWPVSSLTLGSRTYSQAELLMLLSLPTRGDASIKMAHHLIAAKLNLLVGTDPAPISDAIAEADALLSPFTGPLPYRVRQRTDLGKAMTIVKSTLDDYNNGGQTPGCVPE